MYLVGIGADPSSSLFDACRGGNLQIVKYIYNIMLDKEVEKLKNCRHCLAISLELDHMEIFYYLMDSGVDVQSVRELSKRVPCDIVKKVDYQLLFII